MSPAPYFSALYSAAFLAIAGCATAEPPAPSELAAAKEIDAAVQSAMASIRVMPGISVAIWTPDGVYARGFGVIDVDTGAPATADTLFYTASSTKSMTALAMEILHQRGDIDLDQTLRQYAPDADFPGDVGADAVHLRDLLTHTSGMDNPALVVRSAISGQHSPEIDWRLLSTATIKSQTPQGAFEYSNSGYNILTTMTDRKLSKPWQDLLQAEIFDPAGMAGATARISAARTDGRSIARPHFGASPGGVKRLSLEKSDATQQSAGGVYLSARDALIWLELMIRDGKVGEVQAAPAVAVASVKRPQAPVGGTFADYSREEYARGWYVGRYRDEAMLHSFGSFAGSRSHVSFLPGRKAGVAVFSNDGSVGAQYVDLLANFIYDTLAGRANALSEYEAGVGELAAVRDQLIAVIDADQKKRAARKWMLSAPMQAYAGVYENANFGEIEIEVVGNSLRAGFGVPQAIAEPFTQPDAIRVEFEPMRGEVIVFRVDPAGAVIGLSYAGERFMKR